jgi:BirA family biotin operon repressor/biotin-[acetyl-CoA-carboxylase] ligase
MVPAMSRRSFRDVRHFDELDSTNTYLLAESRAGATEGVVVVADHQTAGRGRLGRTWEAPPGSSVLLSVLLRPDLGPADLHCCTALVALAAADAAAACGVDCGLKWPNDLVIGDRKVAGVLAEVAPAPPGATDPRPAVVVGVGINVAWPGPPGTGGTCLADHAPQGAVLDRNELIDLLLDAVAGRRPELDDPAGRARLADETRRRCATLGRRVRVETAAGTLTGTATGLTDAGHLVVRTDGGDVEVAAGDVVHVRDAEPRAPGPAGDPGVVGGGTGAAH